MKLNTFRMIEQLYLKAREELCAEYSWQTLAYEGFKVEAIKKYRQEKECGLKEAKDAIDSFCETNKIGVYRA